MTAPEAGDLVWTDFSPTRGHEQSGFRPALVLSPARFNRVSGLALVCAITSRAKGYAFEVPLPPGGVVDGVVLSQQVRTLDWNARPLRPAGRVDVSTLEEVRARVASLLER